MISSRCLKDTSKLFPTPSLIFFTSLLIHNKYEIDSLFLAIYLLKPYLIDALSKRILSQLSNIV